MTIRLRVGHPSPKKELDSPLWSHLWVNWLGAYRFLECSLSLQSFYCLNFSVLTKSWLFLIDDRPNRPGVHFLLSIFVAGCFPGDSGGIEPICQFRTHRRLGIKVWRLDQEDCLEEGKTTTPVFLPGESHGQRILVGYSPWGCTESDMTEATEHTCVFAIELWQQMETRGRKQDGCGKGMIWERVWFLEAVLCCPFLLFFLFLWFYDCILMVARQHWLHLLEADVPINLYFRDWKLRRMHYAIWKKQMKISSATFKLWISPELGSWRWMSFYNWKYLRIIV